MHKQKTEGAREALPMFFKHPLGSLKYTLFGNRKENKNIKGLCRKILNETKKYKQQLYISKA